LPCDAPQIASKAAYLLEETQIASKADYLLEETGLGIEGPF
jgi:hypothetical protein